MTDLKKELLLNKAIILASAHILCAPYPEDWSSLSDAEFEDFIIGHLTEAHVYDCPQYTHEKIVAIAELMVDFCLEKGA